MIFAYNAINAKVFLYFLKYSEPCQTSKSEERFAIIVNGFQPLTIFVKRTTLDVRQGSEYASNDFIVFWRDSLTDLCIEIYNIHLVVTKDLVMTISVLFQKHTAAISQQVTL